MPGTDPGPSELAEVAAAYEQLSGLLEINAEVERLRLAARLAVSVVGGSSCAITLELDGSVVPVVGSDHRAVEVDMIQYAGGAGPGFAALRTGAAVAIPDMRAETRWAKFPRLALAVGVRSCLSLPLLVDGRPVGVLSVYAEQVAAFPPYRQRALEVLAGTAAKSLPSALRFARGLQPSRHPAPESSRAVIEQALLVLVGDQRCGDPYQAFDRLWAESRRRDAPLSVVAAELVDRCQPIPSG